MISSKAGSLIPLQHHIENKWGTNTISWNILQEECGAHFA